MRCVRSFIIGLFDNFAVGSVHTINTDTQMITGAFVGFVDGVVLLSNATVRSATTGAVLAVGVPIIRIPIGRINYVI